MQTSQARNIAPATDEIRPYHHIITRCLNSLGYTAGFRGVCDGIGAMALQAILIDDVMSFNQRLIALDKLDQQLTAVRKKLLNNIGIELEVTPKYMPKGFHEILMKSGKFKILSNTDPVVLQLENTFAAEAEQILKEMPDSINIQAFLDSVVIQQNPRYVSFGEDIVKYIEPSQNPQVEAQGGIKIVDEFTGIYTADELTLTLKMLQETLANYRDIVMMRVTNYNHTIYVGYNPVQHLWIFSDANSLPIKQLQFDSDITSLIMQAFYTKNVVALTLKVVALGKKSADLQPYIETWTTLPALQSILTITPEKAQLKEPTGCNWLFIATSAKDEDLVNKLLAAGADPNPFMKRSGGIISVLNTTIGKNNIALNLLKHGAIPNFSDYLLIQIEGSAEAKSYLESDESAKRRSKIRDTISNRDAAPDSAREAALDKIIIMCTRSKDVAPIEVTLTNFLRIYNMAESIIEIIDANKVSVNAEAFTTVINNTYQEFAKCKSEDELKVVANFKSNIINVCNTQKQNVLIGLIGIFGIKFGPVSQIKQVIADDLIFDAKPTPTKTLST
jgi:hypothetical protein